MLEKEFQYYLKNQSELVKKYNGKYIVIIGEKVVGDYNNEQDAYTESEKKYKLGTFLIQLCVPGDSAYTQSYHTRVAFA